jgi:hypothetical protein
MKWPPLQFLGLELDDVIAVDDIADMNRPATDLTVLDIGLASDRYVQHHGNRFAAIGTFEKVFHSQIENPEIGQILHCKYCIANIANPKSELANRTALLATFVPRLPPSNLKLRFRICNAGFVRFRNLEF